MNKFFGKTKSPSELGKNIKAALDDIKKDSSPAGDVAKAKEKLESNTAALKFLIYGDDEVTPKEEALKKVMQELRDGDLIADLLKNLGLFPFEARRSVEQIGSWFFRTAEKEDLKNLVKEGAHPDLLTDLLKDYKNSEIALHSGAVLREAIRDSDLAKKLLDSKDFYEIFEHMCCPDWDVASDAFLTFETLLTKDKAIAAAYLGEKYERFFKEYTELLKRGKEENGEKGEKKEFALRRQSLHLLGQLLQTRQNFDVMIRFINDAENLKTIMGVLRIKVGTIQLEAFHVLKMFVVNPQKSEGVAKVLEQNKEALINFLKKFQVSNDDDEFHQEKGYLIKLLSEMGGTMRPAGQATAAEAEGDPAGQATAAGTGGASGTQDGSTQSAEQT